MQKNVLKTLVDCTYYIPIQAIKIPHLKIEKDTYCSTNDHSHSMSVDLHALCSNEKGFQLRKVLIFSNFSCRFLNPNYFFQF